MLELIPKPDQAYGDGTFTDQTGEVYRGSFIKNKAYGYCIKTSPIGGHETKRGYEKTYANAERHAKKKGLIIMGEMKDNRWNGKVTVYSVDGRVYN